MTAPREGTRVAIVGGGLAGMATAVALREHAPPDIPLRIELYEARRRLGGRATSYEDPTTGMLIDHCQHVSMNCCTALTDLGERTGLTDEFSRSETLHFFAADGTRCDFSASRWLPPPLHLLPGLWRQSYLSRRDRITIICSLGRLMRYRPVTQQPQARMLDWLRRLGNRDTAIERFWTVVLVSALGESLDQVSVMAAKKVFVDGFMANRHAYEVLIPKPSLDELFGNRLVGWLRARQVAIHTSCGIKSVCAHSDRRTWHLGLPGDRFDEFDQVVVAVPWHRLAGLLDDETIAGIPKLDPASGLFSAPITGAHLWFDRPITDLPHAVLVGTLGQWMFRRNPVAAGNDDEHYVQLVVSASHELGGRAKEDIVNELLSELQTIFPPAAKAKLLRWRLVTEQQAVFSMRPDVEQARPAQRTPLPGLTLAGDWTDTGWPATMEGAVRSGYLAAEAILEELGCDCQIVPDDLPRGWLARLLIR